jgi:predicted acyl esterase
MLTFYSGHFNLDVVPGRVGVPKSRVSGFEKFEAPDPAEWTARGYAIVNVDARGVYDSEGNIRYVMLMRDTVLVT